MALPKHSGWSIERIVPLLGGSVVGTSLLLGRTHSPKWRGLTAFASANLVLYGIVGWCPMSLLLQNLGVPRAAACPVPAGRGEVDAA
ncbi:DUF2892 domain-containing protein [Prescottella agglutinans]|uniref:DUF2892 domain-containing protein n=1 Tax=Prescottella agglutinans TaxID=1644129 RepID=A0A3S3E8G0_9NOCA|nr:DUF2892 domain-containing protein [Prescottella agglutinans]RVW07701.1 DUF2892 domain-containing protein [Prescottella agglutinans]